MHIHNCGRAQGIILCCHPDVLQYWFACDHYVHAVVGVLKGILASLLPYQSMLTDRSS
jgi:hypothetical protein